MADMPLTFFRIAFSILPCFGREPVFATGLVRPFEPAPCFKLVDGFELATALALVPPFELRPGFALVRGFAPLLLAVFFVLMNSLSFFHRQPRKL
ncbi:MAG: hypothetical protein ABSG03_24585 [Bryobacteraceae bacterium]